MAFLGTAFAQEEPTTADTLADLTTAIDTGWLMVTAILVFFMQAGFAMVESGFVRSKNTSNILMKNLLDACVGGLCFWAFGYAIAYGLSGEESNGFIGDRNWFLNDFDNYAFWFFRFAFAATAATIVSGAMAERTKFSAYLVYTVFISAIIYPFVVHWVWDANGWLTAFTDDPFLGEGYVDFAGSGRSPYGRWSRGAYGRQGSWPTARKIRRGWQSKRYSRPQHHKRHARPLHPLVRLVWV